jgi:hypothetical protein
MSWSCPYLKDEICELHGKTCRPGKGKCILKDKYKISSLRDTEIEKSESLKKEDQNLNKEQKYE